MGHQGEGDLAPVRTERMVNRADFGATMRTVTGEDKMTSPKWLKEWEMEQKEKEEKSQAENEISSKDDIHF